MSDLTPYPESAAAREAAERPPGAARGYASWGRRAAAYLLDTLIVFVLAAAAVGAAFAIAYVGGSIGIVLGLLIGVSFVIVFPIAYHVFFVGKSGQTPARRALGIRVVDDRAGGAIGYGRAFGRYIVTVLFGIFTLPLVLDYLFPLWDDRNQTLHDKVVSSVVVRE